MNGTNSATIILKPALKQVWWRYGLIAVALVVSAVLVVVDPILYGRMVDVIVVGLSGDPRSILPGIQWLLVAWAGIFLLSTGIHVGLRAFLWKTNIIVGNRFASEAVHDMLRWSRQRFSRLASGRAIKVMDEAWDAIFFGLSSLFEDILPTFFSFLAVVITGFLIDWRLTVASLLIFPIALVMGIVSWRKATPKQNKITEEWANVSRHMGESVSNIALVQDFAQECRREHSFKKLMYAVTHKQMLLNIFWSFFYASGGLLTLLGRIVVFVVGAWLVVEGNTTLGILVTFLGMLNYLLSPIQYTIANSLPRFSKAVAAIRLYGELAGEKNDVKERPDAAELKRVSGRVDLIDVTFTYDDQTKEILKSISLSILSGTSCALVGPSGAGKSTLAKLINRTIDPSEGAVLVDDHDVREYTLSSLRRHIGVVTQETYLFHDTVFNNVRFVQPKATRRRVIEACRKAQAHTFISKLPNGYDSVVGERGVKLSGGERQRIALARIFLADPPILVLDESTSALDSETEKLVQESLQEVMKKRTTIVIAHRLSTVYLADQIIVMQDGKIVDCGTHDTLIEKKGLYDRLWSLQAGGYIK